LAWFAVLLHKKGTREMIHIRKECEPVRYGFNFYSISDKGSFGFVFKVKNFQFMCRYSKITKKWILQ
jgi:hypothetical protein